MDFEYITLTRKEYKRLKQLSRSPSGLPSESNESGLMNNHLITRNRYGYNSEPRSVITQEGKNYLLYRRTKRSERSKDSFRFVLSTVIALLALIIAVAALLIDLWQLGLL